jgi:hypothetical protein
MILVTEHDARIRTGWRTKPKTSKLRWITEGGVNTGTTIGCTSREVLFSEGDGG